ncbi:MAG: hypothetical protein GY854_18160 [Deltaproteobacteria bacterium]|nr:hypothetical protein [Deltaproteobacteria bacterium]
MTAPPTLPQSGPGGFGARQTAPRVAQFCQAKVAQFWRALKAATGRGLSKELIVRFTTPSGEMARSSRASGSRSHIVPSRPI